MRAAEPVPAPVVVVVRLDLALPLAGPEEADESGGKEADGDDEREGDVGLELAAAVARGGDVVPVEDGAAAVADQLFTC